jgi:hemoglobin-like flavoprotein
MKNEEITLFHESLDRVLAHPEFIDYFYKGFFEAHPDVAGFFTHTDMAKQKRKLASSLKMLADLAEDLPGTELYMNYLAKLHTGYRIPENIYQVWLDALLGAVSHCDPGYSPDLEQVWRNTMQHGIDIMTRPADA